MTLSRKLVSLCPSITETLIDFGLSKSLVGITKFCIHPKEVVASLNKVGGTKDPHLERIHDLDPDLIFMNAEENRKEDYEALAQKFKIDVSEPRCIEDIPKLLRHFGGQTGTQKQADLRALELEEELHALFSEVQSAACKFTFAYFIWRKPWMVVGSETYVSKLFAFAGGQNIFDTKKQRYPCVALKELKPLKPDFVFLADEPFPFVNDHIPQVSQFVPEANVQVLSGDDCCWHGVRSIRGVRLMRKLLRELADLNP